MILNINKLLNKKVKKFLISSMKYKSEHELPTLNSLVVNACLGTELDKNEKFLSNSLSVLEDITLQRPKVILAKKSVSNFKLKEGERIALICSLKKKRLMLFLTKLIFFAIPQIEIWSINNRIFKFDNQYNCNLGIEEHLIFPEIGFSYNLKPFGFNMNLKFKRQKRNYSDRLLLIKLLKLV